MKQDIGHSTATQKLIDHASSVIGLRICYHDRMKNSGLPWSYHRHLHPACGQARKGKRVMRCVEFDAYEVHRDLGKMPEGRIHVCPFGLTEIAVPVFVNSQAAGVLFAGPCWTGKSPCPYPDLISVEKSCWLEERRTILVAISERFSSIIQMNEEMQVPDSSRKNKIIDYLRRNLDKTITVTHLSSELSLSPSRTSHVVNQLFKMSLPNLINDMKLQQASYWLLTTELSIGEIALRFGYHDQNYFTRLFSKKYEISPSAYRNKHPFEA